MKITSIIRHTLLATIALAITSAALPVQADDHKPYDHDKTGYFDDQHHHHPFTTHNHHRGYWDTRGGSRVFITI